MIDWDTCQQEFAWDGAWRDIYVHNTTIDNWRVLIQTLQANYSLEYFVDGTAHPLPASIEEIFATRDTTSPLLRVHAGVIMAACHFFGPDQIEFDIDPRNITSQATLDELLGFLKVMGDALKKAVWVTYENDRDRPVIIFEPNSSRFEYRPFTMN